MTKLRLLVGATAMLMPLTLTPLSASGAALNTFQTTKAETTPPLHGTLPHGEGTVAVTQLTPDPTRPYSSDPSGKTAPSELLVVGRARGEQRADGTYHGHITIAALAGTELLSIDTNPGESKTGPLDSVTSALCSSTGGAVCLGVVTANSTTTATGSTNHFAVANLQLGGLPGVTLPPGVLSALGATAASSDGNITSDGTCQTATGSTLITNANLGPTILADVIKSSTVSKACNNAAPTETDSSTVIPTTGAVTGLLNAIPSAGCASGGNPNPDGSAGGTANTVAGLAGVLDLVCNAADQSPAAATNSSDGGKQATSPYGVREGLDAFVLALGGGSSLVKLTTAAVGLDGHGAAGRRVDGLPDRTGRHGAELHDAGHDEDAVDARLQLGRRQRLRVGERADRSEHRRGRRDRHGSRLQGACRERDQLPGHWWFGQQRQRQRQRRQRRLQQVAAVHRLRPTAGGDPRRAAPGRGPRAPSLRRHGRLTPADLI